MSDLLVKVLKIDSIDPHPNADRLRIAKVSGWQIVVGIDNYKVGDLVIHVPPDALVPRELADKWGVSQYLSWNQDPSKGRVRAVKLRSAPSFGFLAPNDTNAPEGALLNDVLGIDKWEPPEPNDPGQLASPNPLFHGYTDIQNLRNYSGKLNYNLPLVVTEKIHGCSSRIGWIRNGNLFERVIGSHRTQRKLENAGFWGMPFEEYGDDLEAILKRLTMFQEDPNFVKSIIIFGEIYGPGIQDLHYGAKNKEWRAFDIAINGKYIDYQNFINLCMKYDIPTVPELSIGPYSFEELIELAQGESDLAPGQIKEGIVIKPFIESTWTKGNLDPRPKRSIFKILSDDYLCRKGGTEFH